MISNQQAIVPMQPDNTDKPEISILLATLRPDKARKCLESIAETSDGVDYEVVVVSPLDMPNLLAGCKGYGRVKFVLEEKKDGCNKAFTTAYENAGGKYVLAIADDHRPAQDCLKKLLEFMKPHDNEIFLAGVRFHDAYGPGPECKTYGFYYPFNPCIRRDLVEQIGGFYDPCYKSYYGDPDLAMRVWHNSGKVELCPDAWVEFRNEYDEIDLESRLTYADHDFSTFCQRWHPIYGHLVNSNKEADINVSNTYALPGLPPAKCTRLLNLLVRQDWSALKSELESQNKTYLNEDNLFYVFKEMISNFIRIPVDIRQTLSEWLINQLVTQISVQEHELATIFKSNSSKKINDEASSSSKILASIAMFVITGGLKRYPELVVDNYKGVNINYSPRKFYAWPFSSGGFSIDAFQKTTDKFAFCESTINQVIVKIDELMGDAPLVDWHHVRDFESNFTSLNFQLLQNEKSNELGLEQLPDEVCLKIVLYLKLKDWAKIEYLLNETKENVFIITNHLYYVYNEVLRNIKIVPPNLVLKLSQWLLAQLDASLSKSRLIVSEGAPKDVRFLLIKHVGGGLWSDMHDVLSKLLLAEITNRHPIVFWGRESFYSVGESFNSFEQYFFPVSDYSIGDVVSDKYTYYPPTWKFFNVFLEDPKKHSKEYRDVPSFIKSNANVLVSDLNVCMLVEDILPWIKEGHPAFGLSVDDIYRYLFNKYIKLRSDIVDEIQEFYQTHMEPGPILAVHIRSGNKILEVPHLKELNVQYHHEIDEYLKDNPSTRIFLLTDDDVFLDQYRQMYGNILIYTQCNRKTINDLELMIKVFTDMRRKGIETIIDTFLACKCDYFIGNWYSNVSIAIRRLKIWENDKIKLLK